MGLRISKDIKLLIKLALKEDIGKRDLTTDIILPKDKKVNAVIICKEKKAILCGLKIAKEVFKTLDKNIVFKTNLKDGDILKKGQIVAYLKGRAKKIITAERVALNFLSLLSGISTTVYRFIEKVRPYQVKIMDTRKTIPLLRELEKYAVRIGGGYNHRLRLDEMVLIKDNHLKVIGGIENLAKNFKKIKRNLSKHIKVEIEVKNIKEFKIAQSLNPNIVMLDNMDPNSIRKAVKLNKKKIKLEVSGGINLNNIKDIAKTGIDMVSVGELTDSIKSIDFSLEIL